MRSMTRANSSKFSRFDVRSGCSWKKGDNDVPEITEPADVTSGKSFPMVVGPAIHVDLTASEETAHLFQNALAAG